MTDRDGEALPTDRVLQLGLGEGEASSILAPTYPEGFLDSYAGRIVREPDVAVLELISNAWDAGAKNVRLVWPAAPGEDFAITDDGCGMSSTEFDHRWLMMGPAYNVSATRVVLFPDGTRSNRTALGRNGKGRHAMFFFANEYRIRTRKDDTETLATVRRGSSRSPFEVIERTVTNGIDGPSGTELRAVAGITPPLQSIRSTLSTRFIADPRFAVFINGDQVNQFDPEDADDRFSVPFQDGEIRIGRVDSDKASRVRLDSGVTWWTDRRMVVPPSWDAEAGRRILDGRRKPSRAITFIVLADMLRPFVLPDWSGYADDDVVHDARRAVAGAIQANLDSTLGSRQKAIKLAAMRKHRAVVKRLNPIQRQSLSATIDAIQEIAPKVDEQVAGAIVQALTTMKEAESGLTLLHKVAGMTAESIDQLVEVLDKWEIGQAKAVLDLVYKRLALLQELERRTYDATAPELQMLQPLFDRGLWIFGPQYESVEFTSNRQLLTVIRDLMRETADTLQELDSPRLRPDYVVLADRSIGTWSIPGYDDSGEVSGTAKVLILELKRAGIEIGEEAALQAQRYANRVRRASNAQVEVLVLGSSVDPLYQTSGTLGGVRISLLPYTAVLVKAKSRMLNLQQLIRRHSAAGEFTPVDQELEDALNPVQLDSQIDDPQEAKAQD